MSNTDNNRPVPEDTRPADAAQTGANDEDINSFLDSISAGNGADDFLEQLYTDSFKDLNTDFDTLLRSFQSIDPDDPLAQSEAQSEPAPVETQAPQSEAEETQAEPEMEDIFSYSDHSAVNTRSHKSFSDSVQEAMDAEEAAIAQAEQEGDAFRLSLDRIEDGDKGLGDAVEEAAGAGQAGSTRVFSANAVRTAAGQPQRRPQGDPSSRPQRTAGAQQTGRRPAPQNGQRRPQQPKKQPKRSFLFPQKNDSTFEIFRKVLFLVSVVVVVVCLVIIGNTYLLQPYLEKGRQEKIGDLMQGGVSDAESFKAAYGDKEIPTGARYNLAQFYAANADFYGYLEIPGTSISTPVVQGKDNKQYLHKNFFGESTKYGCPFVNYQNTYAALDYNTSIFGHNMEYDNLVFGDLENYRSIDGFKKAPLIHLETMYADYYFKVYAVFLTDSAYDSSGWYFDYIFTQLKDEAECREYIAELDARKLYSTGVDIKPTDKLLTLSTCAYDFSTERLVVVGRLVRDGEDNKVDVSKAVLNKNPRYPDKYYQKKGKTNPYATAAKWIPNA